MTVYEQAFDAILELEIRLWAELDSRLRRAGAITAAQLQILRAVDARRGAARVQDISEDLRITVGAASKVVDRLERSGLAVRTAHPTDRRSTTIALTATGDAELARSRAVAAEALETLLAPSLSPGEAERLLLTLRQVQFPAEERHRHD